MARRRIKLNASRPYNQQTRLEGMRSMPCAENAMLRGQGHGSMLAVPHSAVEVLAGVERTGPRPRHFESREFVGADSRSENLEPVDSPPQRADRSPEQNEPIQAAPLAVIRDAALMTEFQTINVSEPTTNVVSKGLITADEANGLVVIFRKHYGPWVGFGDSDNEEIIARSPLLLCACCLIAVRHSDLPNASSKANLLFVEVKASLSASVLVASQDLDLFQAILILSLWSTTVGRKPLSMDSWLITGFALQHALISGAFNQTAARITAQSLAVYNHLCLSHLHACISMRRKAMLHAEDIEQAKQILKQYECSNFETRMMAELHLYWTMYKHCNASSVNLPQAQTELQAWRKEWTFLFDQPRHQFLQMSFYFAQLLMYEHSLNNKSAAVRESLLLEMVRLSTALLKLAMETSDEQTRHLTDHIYHMITFSAVTLCRLIHRYESELRLGVDLAEPDSTVSRTIAWLRGLGTSSHIGSLMSTIISSVQTKLRPMPSTEHISISDVPNDMTIPDLFGMDSADFDWDAMLPEWQSAEASSQVHGPCSTSTTTNIFGIGF